MDTLTDIIVAIATANEAERLARDLDRRGGAFTSHAAALLRERAERERENVRWTAEWLRPQ